MCGIAGLYLKNPDLFPKLGELFKPMLIEMTSRGPDSAGIAIYRDPVSAGQTKYSLAHDSAEYDWSALSAAMDTQLKTSSSVTQRDTHALMVSDGDEAHIKHWLASFDATVRLVGSGESVEIYKETLIK